MDTEASVGQTNKSIEQLRQESKRMRTIGTISAAVSLAGAAVGGLVSLPFAAVVGVTASGIAAATLLRKLSDDRALIKQLGSNQSHTIMGSPSGVLR
jgi:hypothetical protein